MRTQLHAPATEEEYAELPCRAGPITPTFSAEDNGWCSACRGRGLRIATMGTEERYVGICAFCLAKLADAIRSTPSESPADE